MGRSTFRIVKLAAVAAVGSLLVTANRAEAVQAYALVTNPVSNSASRLYTFDTATPGVFNLVGQSLPVTGAPFPAGLEFNPGGQLFAATNATAGWFHSINPATGAPTLIGGSGLNAGHTVTDLSWDTVGNRMLALGSSGAAGSAPSLYSVNTATGAASLVGTVSGAVLDGLDVSLAVRGDGRIFIHGVVTDRWYSVDRNTFAATQLGPEGFDSNFGQGGTFDLGSGTLYHAAFNNVTFNGELYSVNQTTGLGTLVGQMGLNVAASAVQVTDIAIRIPEPASLSVLGLGGLALVRRRK